MLTRDAIFAINDRKVVEVKDIPDWPDSVFIKELGANDIDRWEQAIAENRTAKIKPPLYFRGLLLSMAICDANGTRMFSDAHAKVLGEKSMKAVDYLYDAIAKLSGLRKEDQDAIEKNSDSGPSESTASNSQND